MSVITERLVAVAQAVRTADHGQRQAIYEQACCELGISQSTLHRKLRQLSIGQKRKQRHDAGSSEFAFDEAQVLSGVMLYAARNNDKRLMKVELAVEALRQNGLIKAERIDKGTGEVVLLSDSAISRALYSYGLHPSQLLAPTPCLEMASLHPNHVWQIDASLCVLYYLKPKAGANGLHIMPHDEFYKNKPKNMARVMADRVWSYEITDHTSGWIYVEYVMGAESGANLCGALINAMQERSGADVMHGRPTILYMDPGSANTSAMALNLCKALGITPMHHAPRNARATGQVEQARQIIETRFESGLRFRPVADLDELNALATIWRATFNSQRIHSRHGKSRTAVWMSITEEQLIKVPSAARCRLLATSMPESRTVTAKRRISWGGQEYDVSQIPDLRIGEKLMITHSPWSDETVQVVVTSEDGHELYISAPVVKVNEFGFAESAQVFGEGFISLPENAAQKDKKLIDQLMMGTDTVEATEAARKAKALPLGGKFDPYKPMTEAQLPTYMPKRGRELDVQLPHMQSHTLNLVETAKRLRARLGDEWSPQHYQWLSQRHPNGITEEALDGIEAAMRRQSPTTLRAVGGE